MERDLAADEMAHDIICLKQELYNPHPKVFRVVEKKRVLNLETGKTVPV